MVGLTLESGSIAPLPDTVVDFAATDPRSVSVVSIDLVVLQHHELSEGGLDLVCVGQGEAGPAVSLTRGRCFVPRPLERVESLTAFHLAAAISVRVTTDRRVVSAFDRSVDRHANSRQHDQH